MSWPVAVTDLCWRTGYWTPAAATNTMAGNLPVGCECDKRDVVPADKCVPAAARPLARTPPLLPSPRLAKGQTGCRHPVRVQQGCPAPAGKAKLDDLAAKSKDMKLEVILAVGHTDRIGGAMPLQPEALEACRRRQDLPGRQRASEANRVYRRQGRSSP